MADPRTSTVDWPRFVEVIGSHQRIMLTTHIRPDCDALGSELAMAAILEQLGKEVRIVNSFDTPPSLQFLDSRGKLGRLGRNVPRQWIDSIDLLLVLDTSAWAQLGEMGEVIRDTKAHKAILDHHVSSDDLGAESFRDSGAEATGRLVAEAAGHLGVQITPEIATPLFAALATDTGWFRFASVSAETYRLAARLIDAGARPDKIYQQLYEDETLCRQKMVGRVMARIETELGGRLIHTSIRRDDFEATGAAPSDSEDVINMTLAVGGTEVAVIFVEQMTGGFKISFRSRSDVDCSRLAEQFGGGGHKKAAGAFTKEPFETAQSMVLDAVRAAMG